MTKAPERIWFTKVGDNIIPNSYKLDDADTKYIRADLHAELMRAADEVARLLNDEADCYAEFDKGRIEMKKALTAYKQAKEKLDG